MGKYFFHFTSENVTALIFMAGESFTLILKYNHVFLKKIDKYKTIFEISQIFKSFAL